VQGYGDPNAKLMFIGEAPGMDESFRSHRPFTGPAGDELTRFLKGIDIDREDIYLTNVVKCNPPGNEDPLPEVIKRCDYYLMKEMRAISPKVFVTLGGIALRHFNPYLILDMVWGIPQTTDPWLFPLYHPALGLHQTRMLPMIEEGFRRLGRWLNGETVWKKDQYLNPQYVRMSNWDTINGSELIAIDTETKWDGGPLYVQLTGAEGRGYMVGVTGGLTLISIKDNLEFPNTTTILHNAMFDLEVLHRLDIHPAHIEDTMVMAYLLGGLPQGLKPLAYRLCGMEMKEYGEVVSKVGVEKALLYLLGASLLEWPNPKEQLSLVKGVPHIKKPQNIGKKILRAMKDFDKSPYDLRERWNKMEGTEVVEAQLGPMPGVDLRDVEEQDALTYACKDADATRRIYPILKKRIEDEGLQEAYEMDIGIIPMLLEMQRNGITVDRGALVKVGTAFAAQMQGKERELQKAIGYHINPGSSQQVAEMMDKRGIIGRKRRGKSGLQSTGVEILEPLRTGYPEIGLILDWRKYETLMSMFVDVIPTMIHSDGKVHTTIKNTRTITGRLAMEEPNLQQQPVRTEESRLIRNAFVASPGYVLASFDYCLAGSTKIITNRGEIPIMNIEVGDGVLSIVNTPGPKPSLTFNTVKKTLCIGVQDMWEIGLEDGSTVRCTGEHKWRMFRGGWVKTANLKVGTHLSHVKEGVSGRYPTWWIYSHRNYKYKHRLVSKWKLGDVLEGFECDHKDGDYLNWKSDNLQYLPKAENRSQGFKHFWRGIKEGTRSDIVRQNALRSMLKVRRTYYGKNNPNYGKRKGMERRCPICKVAFYSPPSHNAIYCSRKCYFEGKNHKVAWLVRVTSERAYQITVEKDHNYILANGLISRNSQIELRVAAHESQDEVMLSIFHRGEDIHSSTASRMFGIPIGELNDERHRRPAKTVNFGILYGISPIGLMLKMETEGANTSARIAGQPILWTEGACGDMIASWLSIFRGVKDWREEIKAHARRYGWVADMFGRRRLTPEVHSTSKKIVEEGLRYAMNQPVQSGAQGIIKKAMVKVWGEFLTQLPVGVVRPLLQIHDDLLFEYREGEEWVLPIIQEMMETTVKLSILISVELKVGEKWGSMKKST
jgi:uracil-DNA glycosylase family 4